MNGMRLIDQLFTGHRTFGPRWFRVTVYGANAMHWALNVWCLGSFWCFHPNTRTYGYQWPWYFYRSPDATPARAVWGLGPGFRLFCERRARRWPFFERAQEEGSE